LTRDAFCHAIHQLSADPRASNRRWPNSNNGPTATSPRDLHHTIGNNACPAPPASQPFTARRLAPFSASIVALDHKALDVIPEKIRKLFRLPSSLFLGL
jgi:hypothetical protein